MSDSGWQWVGPKSAPPPPPVAPKPPPPDSPERPESRSPSNRRLIVALPILICGGVILVLLLQASQIAKLRRELAERTADTETQELGPAALEASDSLSGGDATSEELVRLRIEVGRLRRDNETLRKRIAELELQVAFLQPPKDPSAAGSPAQYQVRTFQLNPSALNALVGTAAAGADAEFAAYEVLRRMLREAGVDFSPPKTMFFNPATGRLTVRGTDADLSAVEQVIASSGWQ